MARGRRRARPSDVLGVPVLPPGVVSVAANRVRAGVARAHAAMAPPPVRILEGLFGALDHRVLVELCRLDVPDVLDQPMGIDELARRVDADAARLERLVRFGASRGWVRIDRHGRVRPSRVTPFLRRDHPGGWRAWVDFAGGAEVTAAIGGLRADVDDPFAAANGAPFFEWMAANPDRWAVFDDAMAAGARMHALALAAALDWSASERVCDVGGGVGELLATLLDLQDHLEGTVVDLPGVVARAVTHPRLTAVAGDAFVHVPAGFDTYLFVNVLHDWDDAHGVRLLANAAAAAGDDGRVLVVEGDAPARPAPDLPVSVDVLMAALTGGGHERDAAAIADLASRAGLRLRRTVVLASADLVHELVPATSHH
ncbi:MAG: methyltransferase [Actinomycetota bacterium]|nr:methyltransferase [Actinomycetota bacterium]